MSQMISCTIAATLFYIFPVGLRMFSIECLPMNLFLVVSLASVRCTVCCYLVINFPCDWECFPSDVYPWISYWAFLLHVYEHCSLAFCYPVLYFPCSCRCFPRNVFCAFFLWLLLPASLYALSVFQWMFTHKPLYVPLSLPAHHILPFFFSLSG